ncbi:RNA polymerase sigma factor [Apibacter sp. HY039]|uniref:RNA polymerase sigma factor n=1 Tax=Apibacter sp. HY039 TaxID=2501476 RepID=UPI000FEC15F0|nr:sigma-70 family RNA polymerase sigma factor [Apibacter sp. HY039]
MDQEIITNIRAGKSYLPKSFYNKNFSAVARYIMRNNGNIEDAQDVFHESFLVLIQKIRNPDFILTSTLSTFLFAIAKNIWLKRLRDNHFFRKESFDDKHSIEFFPEASNNLTKENKVLLWLSQISNHCQKLLRAIFFYNQPIEKLMTKMGWKNKHSASNQKYKCIQQLKKAKRKVEDE